MRFIKPVFFVCFLFLCLIVLAIATAKLKAFRKSMPMELIRGEALMVNPDLLKVLSGEFKGLLADYLLLKAAIIDGGEPEKMSTNDWEVVYELYKQSLALDPLFYQTAFYAQGNIFWNDNLVSKAVEILEISTAQRSWDWKPLWYLGFDHAHFYRDMKKAAYYLFEAAKKPDAPPILGLLAARFSKSGDDTLTSIAMLKAMQEQNEDEYVKQILERRIQAYLGVYKLEQAVAEFKKKYGHLPNSLNELIAKGIIIELPSNPYGEKYIFDPATGDVDYKTISKQKNN